MSYKELIDKVRNILKQWDDGDISYYEFEFQINDIGIQPLLNCIEQGETYQRFGSCCCSSHPPDRNFKCDITIQPHGFTIKRID